MKIIGLKMSVQKYLKGNLEQESMKFIKMLRNNIYNHFSSTNIISVNQKL